MRLRTPRSMTACLVAAGALVIAGCAPYQGNRYTPIGYGPGYPQNGYPQPGYLPVNNPGGSPPIVWNPGSPIPVPNTPNPITPQPPQTPVVLQPVPTNPPSGNPGSIIPVSNPPANPTLPADVTAKWVPWPLPREAAAVALNVSVQNEVPAVQAEGLPHAAAFQPTSEVAEKYEAAAMEVADSERRVDGTNSTPGQDLRYRGGKTLQNLSYVNLYVGGEAAGWKLDDVELIDTHLEAALTDQNLNNVIRQYFNNQPIGTTARPSHPLVGYKPTIVSRGDVQHHLKYLADQGYLNSGYDLDSTIFNFVLPPGTILNDKDQPENAAKSTSAHPSMVEAENEIQPSTQAENADDSTGGLGGYHGSIHYKNRTLYYSVEVYSERRANGFTNGIYVFAEPWKNLCATLYHQICEFRTDPDVEDAIRSPDNPASVRFLGWTSDAGEEISDFPLHSGATLENVITEVPLANGNGMVPVQFNYSNGVHGPEGPIETMHQPVVR